jgi:hypothetical protein
LKSQKIRSKSYLHECRVKFDGKIVIYLHSRRVKNDGKIVICMDAELKMTEK